MRLSAPFAAVLCSLVAVVVGVPAGGLARSTGSVAGLQARLLRAGELRGFTPVVPITLARSAAVWSADSGVPTFSLAADGFVAVAREQLTWLVRLEAGASSVARFKSTSAADHAASVYYEVIGIARRVTFPVPGIPGAHGFTGVVQGGSNGNNIIFSDGPYQYYLSVYWGPTDRNHPTAAQLISAARRLYHRLHSLSG